MNKITENVTNISNENNKTEENVLNGQILDSNNDSTIFEKKPLSIAKSKEKTVYKVHRRKNKNAITKKSILEGNNEIGFTVTPHMDRWINTAVSLMSDNISEISEVSKVSRVAWYKWLKIKGFKEWYYAQYKAKRYMWIPKLDKMGMERAPKSFDYWKAMNQKAGELLDDTATKQPQQVISILGGMTINNIKKEDS